MTGIRLGDRPAAMGPGSSSGLVYEQTSETLFFPDLGYQFGRRSRTRPQGVFNQRVKNDTTRSRSLPTCGYVGRWHAHIATTAGPHRCHSEYSPEDVSGWTSLSCGEAPWYAMYGYSALRYARKAPTASNTREL